MGGPEVGETTFILPRRGFGTQGPRLSGPPRPLLVATVRRTRDVGVSEPHPGDINLSTGLTRLRPSGRGKTPKLSLVHRKVGTVQSTRTGPGNLYWKTIDCSPLSVTSQIFTELLPLRLASPNASPLFTEVPPPFRSSGVINPPPSSLPSRDLEGSPTLVKVRTLSPHKECRFISTYKRFRGRTEDSQGQIPDHSNDGSKNYLTTPYVSRLSGHSVSPLQVRGRVFGTGSYQDLPQGRVGRGSHDPDAPRRKK